MSAYIQTFMIDSSRGYMEPHFDLDLTYFNVIYIYLPNRT